MKLEAGTIIAHYRLEEKLGTGGMATVYKAFDTKLERYVALKFLPALVGIRDEDRDRFMQEAKTASALDHPNICTIYEINETDDGYVFISMAYYSGETLKDKITRGPLSIKEALHITKQICEGLGVAHEKGIVHRDMKPANVMVTDEGAVKILDFGVAKFEQKARFTTPGSVIGTPGYMSPEQASGKEVDYRTDIWATGVLLFEMLTAHLPFEGDNDLALMYSIVHQNPLALEDFRSHVPAGLNRIMERAMAKKPQNRYASMKEFVADIAQINQEKGSDQETKILKPVENNHQSIAVLPFADLSPDQDQEYFSDGLSEEIINALTRIHGLRVVSRNASFQFKGQNLNISQIGRQLNTEKILEGSIRKVENRIRVIVRLINVSDGFLLWADEYEREFSDIFAIQDDISRSVVQKLQIKLIGTTGSRLIKRYTDNLEAYTTYLKGRFHLNKRTADSMEKSIGHFKKAIEMDNYYALAYAGLADAYIVLGLYGKDAPIELIPQAISAATDALEIDESLAEAHISLGCSKAIFQWNWEEAEAEFLRGIELKPEYAVAHHWYAINLLTPLGRFEEAEEEIRNAQEIEPLSLVINATVGLVLYFARQYDTAVDFFQKTLDMDLDYAISNFFLGRALVQTGQYREAMEYFQKGLKAYGDSTNMLATFGHAAAVAGKKDIALKILNQLLELSRKMYVSAYDVAAIYCGLKDFEQAFFWLEKAYDERAYLMIYLNVDPLMDPLRDQDRFQKLVQKINSPK
jgi:serine/threonine protein kinase/Tfp pilus assembly protein PilF